MWTPFVHQARMKLLDLVVVQCSYSSAYRWVWVLKFSIKEHCSCLVRFDTAVLDFKLKEISDGHQLQLIVN